MTGGKFTVVGCSRCYCGGPNRVECRQCGGTGKVRAASGTRGRRLLKCRACRGLGLVRSPCPRCRDSGEIVVSGPSPAAILQLQDQLVRGFKRKSWREDGPFRF